jgi:hypothetical protein
MIGSALDTFQIGMGVCDMRGRQTNGSVGNLAVKVEGYLLTAWFQISILEINPSDPIEKGGRRDAKL